ncbi:13161_t:CDS:1, partial [Acaulospora colombiana]
MGDQQQQFNSPLRQETPQQQHLHLASNQFPQGSVPSLQPQTPSLQQKFANQFNPVQ